MISHVTATEVARAISVELGALCPVPRSSGDIHDHKTVYTKSVKQILEVLAKNRGYEVRNEEPVAYGKPIVRGRCDQVWSSAGQIVLMAECEWYYKTEEQLRDFQKLLESRCQQKVLIHRNDNERRVVPAVEAALASFCSHPTDEEEYIVIRAAERVEAYSFRVAQESGRERPTIRKQYVGCYEWVDYGQRWSGRAQERSDTAAYPEPSRPRPEPKDGSERMGKKHTSDTDIQEILDIAVHRNQSELIARLRALKRFFGERAKSSFGGSIRYTINGTDACLVLLLGERDAVPCGQVDVRVVVDRLSDGAPTTVIKDKLTAIADRADETVRQTLRKDSRQESYLTLRLSTPYQCDQLISQIAIWRPEKPMM